MRRGQSLSIRNIIHPTDFSHGSEVAFGHALKLALGMKGEMEVLHVDREQRRADWDQYPSVRETLSRWGVVEPDAKKTDVANLGLHVFKSACKGTETASAVLDHIERRGADLVVLATHRREGLDRWIHSSLAERVANRTSASTLFIPYGVDGFVDLDVGAASLQRVLIPIDSTPNPQPTLDAVSDLIDAACADPVEVRLLHIGDPSGMPSPRLPDNGSIRWVWETKSGNVVDSICADAMEFDADLIAMTTNGHDGFLDAVRGSTTERVLSQVACPVLAVPAVEGINRETIGPL